MPDLCRIGSHSRNLPAKIGFHRRVLRHGDFEQVDHILHNPRNVNQLENLILLPGIDHQLPHNFGAANRHSTDSLQFVLRTQPAGKLRRCQFRIGEYPTHKVVEIVGNTAGKRSQALQFLLCKGFLLPAFQFRDVAGHHRRPGDLTVAALNW